MVFDIGHQVLYDHAGVWNTIGILCDNKNERENFPIKNELIGNLANPGRKPGIRTAASSGNKVKDRVQILRRRIKAGRQVDLEPVGITP